MFRHHFPIPPDGSSDDNARNVIFKFADTPLHPRVFNMGIPLGEEENHFYPGDTISLIWDARITFDDNSSIRYGEQYLYDASVFLSYDDVLGDEDVFLFSTECGFPFDSQHSCGCILFSGHHSKECKRDLSRLPSN